MPSPVAETLRATAVALDRLAMRWYVFGAQAALLRGSRRMTEDLDVTVFLDEHDMSEVVSCMRQEGFELRVADVDDFVAQTRVLPLMHRPHRHETAGWAAS